MGVSAQLHPPLPPGLRSGSARQVPWHPGIGPCRPAVPSSAYHPFANIVICLTIPRYLRWFTASARGIACRGMVPRPCYL